MDWECWQLVYEARSPLHIGYRVIGNLQKTRYYVLAKNFWGASIAFITMGMKLQNYEEATRFVNNNVRFTYLFPCWDIGKPLLPFFSEEGWVYKTPVSDINLNDKQFKSYYVSSYSGTAISGETNSVLEGSLHHIEYLSPWCYMDRYRPVYYSGFIFLRNGAEISGRKVKWITDNDSIELRRILSNISVGGERRSGFGKLRLIKSTPVDNPCLWDLWSVNMKGELSFQAVVDECPLIAHCNVKGLWANGSVEQVIGREWAQRKNKRSQGAGQTLRRSGLCWVPGSLVERDTIVKIDAQGFLYI